MIMREPTPEEQEDIDAWHAANDPDGDSFDCADNHRIAVIGNDEEERIYAEQESQGCCGFIDEKLITKSGVRFKYGFNYGH